MNLRNKFFRNATTTEHVWRLFVAAMAAFVLQCPATLAQSRSAAWTVNNAGRSPTIDQARLARRDDASRRQTPVTPIGSDAIRNVSESRQLSNDAGQIWQEYDISSFTQRLRDQSKPEETVVDWILRETGTSTWFGEPMGVLSANRDVVRVYHTPRVQAIVKDIIDRFLNSRSEANEVAVRLVTVEHPDWRVKAMPMLTPVQTQTPGLEAWVLSRENAALLLDELAQRRDFREHNSPNLTIYNGQTHTIKSTRPRLFAGGTTGNRQTSFNNGFANLDQVNEGFQLQISPLVGIGGNAIEAVVKCSVDQVERLTPLRVGNVDQFGMYRQSEIQVPQMSSWQLHERFRWPTNEVLLISRGLVATPGPTAKQGVRRLLGNAPARANALLFLESRSEIRTTRQQRSVAAHTDAANYRGRY